MTERTARGAEASKVKAKPPQQSTKAHTRGQISFPTATSPQEPASGGGWSRGEGDRDHGRRGSLSRPHRGSHGGVHHPGDIGPLLRRPSLPPWLGPVAIPGHLRYPISPSPVGPRVRPGQRHAGLVGGVPRYRRRREVVPVLRLSLHHARGPHASFGDLRDYVPSAQAQVGQLLRDVLRRGAEGAEDDHYPDQILRP